MVVGLRLEVKDNINRTVLLIRFHTGIHRFRVEMAGLGYLTRRAYQIALAEQLTGLDAQLAAHNLLIQPVITIDDHLVDPRLRPLEHAQLQID